MRLLIPVIAIVLASCGQSGESGTSDNSNTDTSMAQGSDSISSPSLLTDAEKSEGWQSLFDGQTKNGWHSFNNKGNADAWKVQDGALFLDVDTSQKDRKSEDLVTDQDFENYHLKIDWKISKNGNSGIIFNVKEDPKYDNTYFTGPEMQVLDNNGHPDAKIIKHRAGDLYDLITSKPETVKPAGEWNTAEIIKNGDSLEFKLNGPTVLKTKMYDAAWKKMVAKSKFKQWPDFGTFKTGKIALQDHGNQVWYKNIKIRKL